MQRDSSVSTGHSTFVHHTALDPTGKLLATCSSDKQVRIYTKYREADGSFTWKLCRELSDHVSPVTRVAWSLRRDNGLLLATCSIDRWIYIYRILISFGNDGDVTTQAVRLPQGRGFEKDAITDIAFVPPRDFSSMFLSAASLDGYIRIYDVHMQCLYKIAPELTRMSADEQVNAKVRQKGVTAIAWFPGITEATMTLAAGTMTGRFYLYCFSKTPNNFDTVACAEQVTCESPIQQISWAPSVGRTFQLLAVCSRTSVAIVRLDCIVPTTDPYKCEIFRWPHGAVSAAWSSSATLLTLVTDDSRQEVSVLQMCDPANHQSWEQINNR